MEEEIITIILWLGIIIGSILTTLLRLILKNLGKLLKREQRRKELFFAAYGKQSDQALKDWESKE